MSTLTNQSVLTAFNISIKPNKKGGYINCPFCGNGGNKKSNNKLYVNYYENVFRCAKCGESGNGTDLYASLAHGINPNSIKNDVEKKTLRKKYYDEFYNNYKNLKLKKIEYTPVDLPTADVDRRNDVYTEYLFNLELSREHYNNLILRGLRKSDIINNGYKSMPLSKHTKNIASKVRCSGRKLEAIPGFFQNKNEWDISKYPVHGFYIPVKSIDKKIQGLQMRFDDNNLENFPRYMWLSSSDKPKGAEAISDVHIAGYPSKTMILTEGPLKADIIYRFTGISTIAIAGVNALSQLKKTLEYLKYCGVETILIAFDMDIYEKEEVQRAFKNLLELINSFNFKNHQLKWDKNFKGLDDYLLFKYKQKGGKLDPLI